MQFTTKLRLFETKKHLEYQGWLAIGIEEDPRFFREFTCKLSNDYRCRTTIQIEYSGQIVIRLDTSQERDDAASRAENLNKAYQLMLPFFLEPLLVAWDVFSEENSLGRDQVRRVVGENGWVGLELSGSVSVENPEHETVILNQLRSLPLPGR